MYIKLKIVMEIVFTGDNQSHYPPLHFWYFCEFFIALLILMVIGIAAILINTNSVYHIIIDQYVVQFINFPKVILKNRFYKNFISLSEYSSLPHTIFQG